MELVDFVFDCVAPKKQEPIGFVNLGNTCYMNAGLQALLATPKFTEYLMNADPSKNYWVGIMQEFLKEISQATKTFKPSKLKQMFEQDYEDFEGFRQHDAQEFLIRFIELFTNQKNKYDLQQVTSFRNFMYSEQSITRGVEPCTHVSISDQGTHFLKQVPLEDTTDTLDLETLIAQTAQEGLLSIEEGNAFACRRCDGYVNALIRFVIGKPYPSIIGFNLLRFSTENINARVNTPILYPSRLNLQVVFGSDVEQPYELYAVVIHAGKGRHSGHYFAYTKRDGVWYECNDEHVNEITEEDALDKHKGAYLLFYKRVME